MGSDHNLVILEAPKGPKDLVVRDTFQLPSGPVTRSFARGWRAQDDIYVRLHPVPNSVYLPQSAQQGWGDAAVGAEHAPPSRCVVGETIP
jgi:hypothetical protein